MRLPAGLMTELIFNILLMKKFILSVVAIATFINLIKCYHKIRVYIDFWDIVEIYLATASGGMIGE